MQVGICRRNLSRRLGAWEVKAKDKPISGEKASPRPASASAIAIPRTALEFARAVRQIYAAAEYEPDLFYSLISIEDPDDLDPTPYEQVAEMLEVVIGENPVVWDGSKEQGLGFLDMVIELLESSSGI